MTEKLEFVLAPCAVGFLRIFVTHHDSEDAVLVLPP
jgi:hypothetical protein